MCFITLFFFLLFSPFPLLFHEVLLKNSSLFFSFCTKKCQNIYPRLSIYLPNNLSFCSIYLSIHLAIHPSISTFFQIIIPMFPFIYPPIFLPIQSIHPYQSHHQDSLAVPRACSQRRPGRPATSAASSLRADGSTRCGPTITLNKWLVALIDAEEGLMD